MYDRKQDRDLAYQKKKELQEIKKMKKTIVAILVIAIAAFSCFAEAPIDDTSDNTVQLTGSVAKVWTPSILLQGKFDTGEWGSSVAVGELKAGGTVDFKILDNTEVNSTIAQTLTVSVTCNPWVGGSDSSETRAITQSVITPGAAANGVTPSNPTDPADTMKLLLTYDTFNYHKLSNQAVATFTASWQSDADAGSVLGAQNYTASVVINVVANN